MCCFLAVLALFGPRVALVLLWLFGDYLARAYDTILWPALGFLFLPWTTLAYAVARNDLGGLSGLGLAAVLLGVVLDLGALGGGARSRRA